VDSVYCAVRAESLNKNEVILVQMLRHGSERYFLACHRRNRLRFWFGPCNICGGKFEGGQILSLVPRFSPVTIISPIFHMLLLLEGHAQSLGFFQQSDTLSEIKKHLKKQ
jgi:hypothetical protein